MSSEKERLEVLKRIGDAFSPFHPIQLREFFAGRIPQIERIQQATAAQGQHIILYGDRGVGKTSLANIVPVLTKKKCLIHRCNTGDTYDRIFAHFLKELGHEMSVVETSETYSSTKHAEITPVLAKGGLETGRGGHKRLQPYVPENVDPALVLNKIGKTDCVLIIDEYDRSNAERLNRQIADSIKALSDANSPCKIIVVGVATSVNDLIGEHQSIERSLCQIALQRMSRDELLQIVDKGGDVLHVDFNPIVKAKVVNLSDGLPYYTQLLAYYSVYSWAQSDRSAGISNEDLTNGLNEAISNANESLRNAYSRAIKTVKGRTDRFRNVLWACAMPEEVEVQAQVIAENVGTVERKRVTVLACSYHLSELAKDSRGHILTRVSKGWYRFSNPLMRGYVRLQMEYDNLLFHKGQLVFPFMQ